MGCSASRPETLLSMNLDDPSSSSSFDSTSPHSFPKPRAFSLPTPLVHHPPLRKGDTQHLVSLTSTTYGSLLLIDPKNPNLNDSPHCSEQLQVQPTGPNVGVTRSRVLAEDSVSPDSVINTWELMDGLDDSDFDSTSKSASNPLNFDHQIELGRKPSSCRYTTFDGPPKKMLDSFDDAVKDPTSQTKPLWKHLSEEALLAKMDPNVVYSYRRALSSRHLGSNQNQNLKPLESFSEKASLSIEQSPVLGADEKILVYFTSLRGIRKTYEDCCAVRMILRGFRVPVDERDISMDSAYRKELESTLQGKAITLPQVFIRGKYVGGATEIRQLNETGELAKLLDGFPVRDPGFVCETCGEVRFIPCPSCGGSRKIFDEDEESLRRCLDCNENGLIRCPECCI